MSERLDNLNIMYIKDKKEFFFKSVFSGEIKLENILTVDIFDCTITNLKSLFVEDVLNQIESKKFVWLLKEHL